MRLDTKTWALIPLAIALNAASGNLTSALRLPVYLDSLGTVLTGALAGPWAGALAGLFSNIVSGLIGSPVWWCYAPTAVLIGILAGLLTRQGFMANSWRALLGGMATGIAAAALSAPITAYALQGSSGGGTDVVVALFRYLKFSGFTACLAQGLLSDPLDKMLTFLVVRHILAGIPLRLRSGFAQGHLLNTIRADSRLRSASQGSLQGDWRPQPEAAATSIWESANDQQQEPGFLTRSSPHSKLLLTLTCLLAAFSLPVTAALPADSPAWPSSWAWLPEAGLVLTPHLPLLMALLFLAGALNGSGTALCRLTLIPGLPLALSLILINGIIVPWGSSSQLTPTCSWAQIVKYSGFSLRLICSIEALALLLVTTRPADLWGALEEWGCPPRLTYVLSASLNFIPTMQKRAYEILQAQSARGMALGQRSQAWKAALPLLGPLMLEAIAESSERSLLLEARGFTAGLRRTSLHPLPSAPWDRPLRIILLIALFILLGRLFI